MNTAPKTYDQELKEKLGDEQSSFNLFGSPISRQVWNLKYARDGETSIEDTTRRVYLALTKTVPARDLSELGALMRQGVLFPGGRVLAGAGLGHHDSTLINCYVMGTLEDSLDGIMSCLTESAKTQKFGGGIGIDFTPLRPKGAAISTAAYFSGGPVAFAGMWDAMGHALQAGDNRRGGKMATLRCDHPDILEFVTAKSNTGTLTSFNVSVLVTDEFIQAVEDDCVWNLIHKKPKKGLEQEQETIVKDGIKYYIWDTIPAKVLWEAIMRNTYDYSEPGIILIDRINRLNPLYYAEEINCTNPCGEQPLPAYGACDLGHINLARLVLHPFKSTACINWEVLTQAVRCGVRMLDTVLDETKYPLREQYTESSEKRRIGLGVTGLADMLTQLGVTYGSGGAEIFVEKLFSHIREIAVLESVELAKKHGAFPAFDADKHTQGEFFSSLPDHLIALVKEKGIRHGTLLTVAPTGTTSIVFGDVSGGCEPHFAHRLKRKIIVKDYQNNDTFEEVDTYSYSTRMFAHVNGFSVEESYKGIMESDLPCWVTADQLSPHKHVRMQGLIQKHICSSISKTVNCPEDISFTDFENVYWDAINEGCKGCATYRPSTLRGAILTSGDSKKSESTSEPETEPEPEQFPEEVGASLPNNWKREGSLKGVTHRLRWPGLASTVFVTVNHIEPSMCPVEVFISSKNDHYNEWSVALSVMISKLLQVGVPAEEVGTQLEQITLSQQGAWLEGKHYGSIIAKIGELIKNHWVHICPDCDEGITTDINININTDTDITDILAMRCSACGSCNISMKEDCLVCTDCGQSKCD